MFNVQRVHLRAQESVFSRDGHRAALGIIGVVTIGVDLAAANVESVPCGPGQLDVEARLVRAEEDAERAVREVVVLAEGAGKIPQHQRSSPQDSNGSTYSNCPPSSLGLICDGRCRCSPRSGSCQGPCRTPHRARSSRQEVAWLELSNQALGMKLVLVPEPCAI
jgi:hypothetical protein